MSEAPRKGFTLRWLWQQVIGGIAWTSSTHRFQRKKLPGMSFFLGWWIVLKGKRWWVSQEVIVKIHTYFVSSTLFCEIMRWFWGLWIGSEWNFRLEHATAGRLVAMEWPSDQTCRNTPVATHRECLTWISKLWHSKSHDVPSTATKYTERLLNYKIWTKPPWSLREKPWSNRWNAAAYALWAKTVAYCSGAARNWM